MRIEVNRPAWWRLFAVMYYLRQIFKSLPEKDPWNYRRITYFSYV